MTTSTTILTTHRGYTVTDEAYGSEPFTIYTPEGRVLDHCDEETIVTPQWTASGLTEVTHNINTLHDEQRTTQPHPRERL